MQDVLLGWLVILAHSPDKKPHKEEMFKFIKKAIFILLIALSLGTQTRSEEPVLENKGLTTTSTTPVPKTNLEKIADINMKSFPWSEESWSSWSWEEYLTKSLHHRLNPTKRNKREKAFNVFIQEEKKQLEVKKEFESNPQTKPLTNSLDSILNDSITWDDLNLFCGKSNPEKFVANVVNKSITEYGTIASYLLLAHPTDNIDTLKKRQNVIRFFIDNPEVAAKIKTLLTTIAEFENCMLGCWAPVQDDYARNCKEELSFKGLFAPLNYSEALITTRSFLLHENRISRLVFSTISAAVLLSYGILHITNIINVPAKLSELAQKYQQKDFIFTILNNLPNQRIQGLIALIAGAYFCQETYHMYQWNKCSFLLEKNIHIIIQAIAKTIDAVDQIHHLVNNHPILKEFEEFSNLNTFFDEEPKTLKALEDFFYNLGDETLTAEPSLFSSKGVVIQTYSLMDPIKKSLSCALASIGRIDAYLGLATLYKTHEHKNHRYAFVNYEQTKNPFIKLTDFWHPLVNEETVVTNNIQLGNGQRNNMLITGPNEGGKSTSLKTIALCLVMGQTIGLAPATSCSFAPFASIATYLNITDDIGVGNSLFKAEVLRTQALLEKLNKLPLDKFSFTAFDEVFNGTTPVEGELAAYGVADYLGRYNNNICIIATHFHMLTGLETTTDSYKNYKVSVSLNQDGSITYPHKLEAGISGQSIAFAILRNQGFDSTILDPALQKSH